MFTGNRRHRDTALLLALACGATIEAAAQKSGLSPATVYRRLREKAFQKQLTELRSEMLQRAAATLTAAASEAVRTLLSLQKDTVPHAVRLGAARAILELGIKLRESNELAERIADLEARLAQTAAKAA